MIDSAILQLPLSGLESKKLDSLEETIKTGLAIFYEVGSALKEIRDRKLYREVFSTFEDYCRQRWGMERAHCYRLIDSAELRDNLSPMGDILPANERQARPLASLEPDQQREAWQKVLESAPETEDGHRVITAKVVSEVISSMVGGEKCENIHFSSDSSEWYTPTHIIEAAATVMGNIDLDPCSNSINDPNVPASTHYTIQDDGLMQPWSGRVYLNPPYGREIGKWVELLKQEYEAGTVSEAIALLPARTDTEWFKKLREYPRCFLRGRLRFSGHHTGAPFPSVVFYLGNYRSLFANTFEQLGDIFIRFVPQKEAKERLKEQEAGQQLATAN